MFHAISPMSALSQFLSKFEKTWHKPMELKVQEAVPQLLPNFTPNWLLCNGFSMRDLKHFSNVPCRQIIIAFHSSNFVSWWRVTHECWNMLKPFDPKPEVFMLMTPPYSTLILGVFPLDQITHVGVSERISHKLFGGEIIFEVFQPVWSRYLNVTNRQTDRRLTVA